MASFAGALNKNSRQRAEIGALVKPVLVFISPRCANKYECAEFSASAFSTLRLPKKTGRYLSNRGALEKCKMNTKFCIRKHSRPQHKVLSLFAKH